MTAFARAAFAAGYAQHGTFPIPSQARALCRAIEESEHTGPHVAHLIVEAGGQAGHRAAREKAHDDLYDFHSAELATIIAGILRRLDATALASELVRHAAEQASAQADPVLRRRAVAGLAIAAVKAQITGDDRVALTTLNAAGWAHATAMGTAEAQASPPKGGPPDSAKVAGLATAALAALPDSSTGQVLGWTDEQLNTLAMGAALAAGDGAAFDDAVKKVKDSLTSTTRATKVYADQLHNTLNKAFVAHVRTTTPTAWLNWVVNSGNPCPTCTSLAAEGPYAIDATPTDPPIHPNCLCSWEVAAAPVLVDATSTGV